MPVPLSDKKFDFKAAFKQAEKKTIPNKVVEEPKQELDFKTTFQQSLKKKVPSKDVSEPSSTFSINDEIPSTPAPAINRIKTTADYTKNNLTDFTGQVDLTTADGTTLKADAKGVMVNPEYVQGLQKRITDNAITDADVLNISQTTKKSPQVVNAYLKKGKQYGFAVESLEKEKKTNDELTATINNFNNQYGGGQFGKQYNPQEILSSADKTAQFLQEYESKTGNRAADIFAKEFTSIKADAEKRGYFDVDVADVKQMALQKAKDELSSIRQNFDEHKRLLNNHIINQTIVEDKKNGVPQQQTIIKIAARTNPKGFSESIKGEMPTVNTPVNIAGGLGDVYDAIFGVKEKEDLLNSVKGEAELQYNDAIGKMAVNKISQGVISGDNNLIQQGKAELDSVDDQVIYKYPSLVKQEIARRVSETLARESGQMEGSQTDNYTLKVTGATKGDYLRVMKDLGYLDNPKTRDIAMSMSDRPDLFADASYTGGIKDNFLHPFKELGLSIADISGFRNARDILSDKRKDEMFPKELEGTKADFKLLGQEFRVRNILNTTANLAGMATIAAATEGTATGLGATAATAKSLGAYTSFGLPSYDAALKDSYNFLDNDASRSLYATMTAITNAEGGRLLDLGKIVRIPGVSEVYAKMATRLTDKTLTKTGVKELLGEAQNKYVDFAIKYGKNVTKGAATMAYFTTSNNITRLLFGDDRINSSDIIPQAGTSFIDGVLGMSIMGAFGAAGEMRAEKNTTYKGFIYNLALNHDATADIFKQAYDKGQYTKSEYEQKMQILNTARAAKGALDLAQTENNVLLNENQKSVYVANKTAAAVLKKQLDDLPPEKDGQKSILKKQIENLDQQNRDVMQGLQFSPTLEPLYDLFEAEKKYNEAMENANEGNGGYEKVEKAKNDYDNLVNKYFNRRFDVGKGEKNIISKEDVAKPNSGIKKFPLPEKPVDEMTSSELDNHIEEVKKYQKETKLSKEEEDALNPEQSDEYYGKNLPKEGVYDVTELQRIRNRVSLIEEAENANDIAVAVKRPLIDYARKKDTENLAVIKAAKRQSDKIGIPTDEFLGSIKEQLKKEFKGDAEALSKEIFDAISTPTEVKGEEVTSEPQKSGRDVVDERVVGKPLTKEAENLIASVGEGSMPTFITKNLEKIAADNGVEITDKMTANDVVNALKEKQQSLSNKPEVKTGEVLDKNKKEPYKGTDKDDPFTGTISEFGQYGGIEYRSTIGISNRPGGMMEKLPYGKGYTFWNVARVDKGGNFRDLLKKKIDEHGVVYTISDASEFVINAAKKLVKSNPEYVTKEIESEYGDYFAIGKKELIENNGINNVFENNPELGKVGTSKDYSDYVSSVFPESKVKEVVYHGTNKEFDKFEKKENLPRTQRDKNLEIATDGFHFVEEAAKETYAPIYGKMKPAVLDLKNPIKTKYDTNEGSTAQKLEYLTKENIEEFKKQGYDSGIIERDKETEYIVFEPEQIHVLGTKSDVENFKKWKSTAEDISSQSKTENNGNEKNSQESSKESREVGSEKGSEKSSIEGNGENVTQEGKAEPVSSVNPSKEDAAKVIETLKGKIPDFEYKASIENPELALREIADQALGYTRNGEERVPHEGGGNEEAMRRKYGDEVVDKAIEMFSPENKVSDVIESLDRAAQSKKSMREKDRAMEKEAEKYGEEGKRALEINRNFDKIVKELKEQNKLEVICK